MLCNEMRSNLPQKRRDVIEGLGLLVGITAFMWLIEGINSLDGQRLDSWGGIHARSISDLWSVFTSWFLHANFSPHLVDNTIPFLFMGAFIALHGARRLAAVTVIVIVDRRARDLAGVAVRRLHGRRQRGRVRLRHLPVCPRSVRSQHRRAARRRGRRGRLGRSAGLERRPASGRLLAGPRLRCGRRCRRRLCAGIPVTPQLRLNRLARAARRCPTRIRSRPITTHWTGCCRTERGPSTAEQEIAAVPRCRRPRAHR